MARRMILLILVLASGPTLLAACGPLPPQAPPAQAKKLDASLSDISTACGEMYQMSAFGPPPTSQIRPIADSASFEARKLASVYARNPVWIYQGETIRLIVAQAISKLRNCGLRGTADLLATTTHER
jgi:hypothetical protein